MNYVWMRVDIKKNGLLYGDICAVTYMELLPTFQTMRRIARNREVSFRYCE